jgi:hypothetical protein
MSTKSDLVNLEFLDSFGNAFESIKTVTKDDEELWSGKDLLDLLDYSTDKDAEEFVFAVNKANEILESNDQMNISAIKDSYFTRTQCYSIFMNLPSLYNSKSKVTKQYLS